MWKSPNIPDKFQIFKVFEDMLIIPWAEIKKIPSLTFDQLIGLVVSYHLGGVIVMFLINIIISYALVYGVRYNIANLMLPYIFCASFHLIFRFFHSFPLISLSTPTPNYKGPIYIHRSSVQKLNICLASNNQ